MFCPNCNEVRPNEVYSCGRCGTQLINPNLPKKGRILPPIIFMVVLLIIGTSVFFLQTTDEAASTPWFTVVNGELFFDEYLYTGGHELTVPATVDGQTVTAISENCFMGSSQLTRIHLPNTIQTISDGAFFECTSLTGMKLPEGLKQIGDDAFFGCASLEAVYIPASVMQIGTDAFMDCPNLCHVFAVGGFQRFHSIYPQKTNPFTEVYSVSGPDAQGYSPS